ncbi:MAG: hypothetical protein AB7V26_11555 [Lysobacterales bacterium]
MTRDDCALTGAPGEHVLTIRLVLNEPSQRRKVAIKIPLNEPQFAALPTGYTVDGSELEAVSAGLLVTLFDHGRMAVPVDQKLWSEWWLATGQKPCADAAALDALLAFHGWCKSRKKGRGERGAGRAERHLRDTLESDALIRIGEGDSWNMAVAAAIERFAATLPAKAETALRKAIQRELKQAKPTVQALEAHARNGADRGDGKP